jgi:flagellar motor switch protein FliN
VDLHVELGATALSIREILKLGAGSIVELDRLAGSSADIIVNGKLIGQGDVVVVGDNFGVRIAKLVEPEKRIDSL